MRWALLSSIRARCFRASISEVIYVLNMQTSLSRGLLDFPRLLPDACKGVWRRSSDGQTENSNSYRIDNSSYSTLEIHVDDVSILSGD